jgi:putative transposase
MLYLMFVRVAGWMTLLARSAAPEGAGLLVLRQEVAGLRRQHPKPELDWAGRAVSAAVARLVPGSLRMSRMVTPGTLLGWHRRLVRGHWAYPQRGGRPPVGAGLAALIELMARENRPPRSAPVRPGGSSRPPGLGPCWGVISFIWTAR